MNVKLYSLCCGLWGHKGVVLWAICYTIMVAGTALVKIIDSSIQFIAEHPDNCLAKLNKLNICDINYFQRS